MTDATENKLPLDGEGAAPAPVPNSDAETPPTEISPAPKTAEPVKGREEKIVLPDGSEITVGDVLAAAFASAGKTVKDWNALTGEERADRLTAALAEFIRAHLPEGLDLADNEEAVLASAADLASKTVIAAPENPSAETPASDEAAPPAASGAAIVILLKDGKLGPKGKVCRITRRKLASLELKDGKDYRTATAQEIAVGG